MSVYTKRIVGPVDMSTSDVTWATVPAGKVWIIREICLVNKNASFTQNAFVNYYIGAVANPMHWVLAIPIQTTQIITCRKSLAAGEAIRGHESGAASGANISISITAYEFDA